ncbi:MAG TPA: hypothetical protein VFW95_13360 [Candidatus Limnocylindria bacterium]|nr:hypothetical protein [Candidatus Limnocylindria bacterium]
MKTDPLARVPLRRQPRPIMSSDLRDNVPTGADDAELLQALRENVLVGVKRRDQLPSDVPAPVRGPRLINVTIRVDDLTLNYARGRAVVEGTSIAALVNRLLEEYSGVARPEGQQISRRIPMFRERRVQPPRQP